ncbi:thialysine N-epsilon-acetyltransferase-like isoform X2 [Haliotis rufescens]|uniref:thialysine N-epsilon-acetyltransferase-like isoform X2 n=1 Tax=Haliotis rufescens TaxID=6454 RepID=UPI00201EC7EC|nr:thialysine N-epsilon-acetyltransferase-like isoform X2 [Haliotis rufescens]
MAEFIVRDARVDDCDEILRLIKGLAEFEKKLHLLRTDTETLKRDGFGEKKVFDCFVAEETQSTGRSRLAGYLMYMWSFTTLTGRFLYVEDLFVERDFRRKGVGSALWASAMKLALSWGCGYMQWMAKRGNTSGINFYKQLGALETNTNNLMTFTLDEDAMTTACSKIVSD